MTGLCTRRTKTEQTRPPPSLDRKRRRRRSIRFSLLLPSDISATLQSSRSRCCRRIFSFFFVSALSTVGKVRWWWCTVLSFFGRCPRGPLWLARRASTHDCVSFATYLFCCLAAGWERNDDDKNEIWLSLLLFSPKEGEGGTTNRKHAIGTHFHAAFSLSLPLQFMGGGYNGLSNIKMEDGMPPTLATMKVRRRRRKPNRKKVSPLSHPLLSPPLHQS